MKQELAATALLASAAAAWGPGGANGPGGYGIFSSFPSCVSSCWSNIQSSCSSLGDYSCYCAADTIESSNQCIENSDCSQSD